jgi:hypothetical protein
MAGHMAHRSYPTTKGQGFPKERATVFFRRTQAGRRGARLLVQIYPDGAGMLRLTSTSNGAS